MSYLEIMDSYRAQEGITDKVWQSILLVSDVVEKIKTAHPDLYMQFIRRQFGLVSNCHYDQSFAEHDVSRLSVTDDDGIEHQGAYWTAEQIDTATASMQFPSGVTRWDKYVAFNVAYSIFGKHMDDDHVFQAGYDLFFANDDWKGSARIWHFMQSHSVHDREQVSD